SGAPARHDLRSVARVVLSGRASERVRAGLAEAFPGAGVVEIEELVAHRPDPGHAATDAEWAPVAVSQEGMLWHEQFTPGSFNLPCLVRRYQGPLDVAALEWALSELVRRHQPLRSTFELAGGEPLQVVGRYGGRTLAAVDLSNLPPPERDDRVAAMLADATSRPFDLGTAPLFEPRLVRLAHDDHLLVVRLHHTVFDDWSVDVFRRELSALYGSKVDGSPSPLAEPATSFAEFCRRQRARLDGEAGAEQRSWWRQELAGAPLAVQLPGDGPPEPGQPLRLDLPPALASALRALAPRLRATPYMTMLAAFSVLVARSTGQDDLLIATVVAHRNRTDIEPLIGCFTKKVPVRLRLHGDPTFPELVARTRASLLGALAHQDLPFDAVVHDALGAVAAEHGVVPQVAVVFQGETPRQVRLALPGLTVAPFELPAESRRERHFSSRPEEAAGGDAPSPPPWGDGLYLGTFLILSLLEAGEGLALIARGSFHRPAALRLLEDLEALLADMAASPERKVSELGGRRDTGGASGHGTGDDVVELTGFRPQRSRLEGALARCPGVAEVAVAVSHDGGDPRLVAYVVADAEPPPTLAQLRHALWRHLPGAPWPAATVVVDALPRLADGCLDVAALPPPAATEAGQPSDSNPEALLLAAMWAEVGGQCVTPASSYWQDFSFLRVLVEAREAGLEVTDEQVARNRTPQTLGADLAVSRAHRVSRGEE
ncbi:MAG: condensation domain-containing protein, partial [Actinomycetota bacterium]|nr:condensation domain-containing protein [Actinomycetota bacterium]